MNTRLIEVLFKKQRRDIIEVSLLTMHFIEKNQVV